MHRQVNERRSRSVPGASGIYTWQELTPSCCPLIAKTTDIQKEATTGFEKKNPPPPYRGLVRTASAPSFPPRSFLGPRSILGPLHGSGPSVFRAISVLPSCRFSTQALPHFKAFRFLEPFDSQGPSDLRTIHFSAGLFDNDGPSLLRSVSAFDSGVAGANLSAGNPSWRCRRRRTATSRRRDNWRSRTPPPVAG